MIIGEFIASGSDDGRWFIWEKSTGRLIKVLMGDGAGIYLRSLVFLCKFVFSFLLANAFVPFF